MGNRLPADYPRPVAHGTAAHALALLQSIRRDMQAGRGACGLGATWTQIAAALGSPR
jgi:hypothetical protein